MALKKTWLWDSLFIWNDLKKKAKSMVGFSCKFNTICATPGKYVKLKLCKKTCQVDLDLDLDRE